MEPGVRMREMPYKLTILLSLIIGEFCLGSVVDSRQAPLQVKGIPISVSGILSHDVSAFNCTAPGYFPLPEFCNVFIYCKELPKQAFISKPFMCPQGRTFHKETESCIASSQVDLESNCTIFRKLEKRDTTVKLVSKRQVYRDLSGLSSDREISCTQGTVRQLASFSEEICLQIVNIGKYVASIAQMIPVPLNEYTEDTTSRVVEYYNSVVQNAKGNANKWRSGNSLLSGIQKSFRLAKAFETTFNDKYDVYQMISRSPRESKELTITKLKGDIEALEGEMREIRAYLDHAISPSIQKFLKDQIKDKERKLEEKLLEASVDPNISMDMKELTYFLGEIIMDADDVKKSAVHTLQQIRPFLTAISTDKTGFDLAIQDVKNALRKSQIQSAKENEDLAIMEEKQNKLEAEFENLRQEVSALHERLSNTYRDSKNEMWDLIQKYRKVDNFKNILNALASLDVTQLLGQGSSKSDTSTDATDVSTSIDLKTILKPLWEHANLQEKNIIIKWETNLEQSRATVQRFETRIRQKQEELFRWREMMADNARNSKNLSDNLRAFNVLDYYLQDIATELPSIDWSMGQVTMGLQKIAEVYSHIGTTLKSIIDLGMKATTTEELNSAKQSMLSHLVELQCYWRHSSIIIADLNSCSPQESGTV